jgi:NADH-quinone oxidoreductase subunit G/NADP-reducing hydrogenase subunit HndD
MNFNIEVNGKTIQVRKGDTILVALFRNGIKVPTLCSMKGLSPTGACRICVVEVEGVSGLVTSCSNVVEDGMKINTHSPRVVKARKTLLELLLSNHPDDCLYCERNGDCELQNLSVELNIRERRISGRKIRHKLDLSSPGVVRDPAKCILCGRCIRVCDEIQSVSTLEFTGRGSKTHVGTTMNRDLNFSTCIACGQCVMVCPTGALHEHSNIDEVQDSISNKSLTTIVQYAPAVTVSLAETFGLKPGKDINGLIVSALRKIGFKYVFDTSFAADLAIMEAATELNERINLGVNLPVLSSCCPAWVRYIEQFYPELLPNLSTTKSPQQIMGAIIKSYFANEAKINHGNIYSVSIMPCLAKKNESQRVEMTSKGVFDVDVVLSTRELVRLIKLNGIDLDNIEPQQADSPFGIRSSAGKLFAASGGTTEGIMRTLHFLRTGKEMTSPKINELRLVTSVKEVSIAMGKELVNVTVVSGLTDIEKLIATVKEGKSNAHFIEVMACSGGCFSGGGQPFGAVEKEAKARARSLYEIDDVETIKVAHKNAQVQEIYDKQLEKPGSEKAKKLLHAKYLKGKSLE